MAALTLLATPAGAKPEEADDALTRVAKAMTKLKGYAASVHVQGGMAEGADHRLTDCKVNETYTAKVSGKLAQVSSHGALRLRFGKEGEGAIKDKSVWKTILSTEEGRLLERLFKRPEEHLARMVKLRKRAEWLEPDPSQARPQGGGSFDFGELDEDEQAPEPGKTRSRDGKTTGASQADDGPTPHRIRIVGPGSEAIEEFTSIVNSGCLSGG